MKKISVVIPCFNCELYLEECLNSVITQDFSDIEIICVDDGSTDTTSSILQRFSSKDERIVVIQQQNHGQSYARNVGINRSSSKYLYFLDSDDYLLPGALRILYDKAELDSADLVITNFRLFFENTKKFGYYRDEVQYFHLSRKRLDLKNDPSLAYFIAPWDRLYKLSTLKQNKIKFIEGKNYEDVPFTISALLASKNIALVPFHLYVYRKDVANAITTKEANEKAKKHRRDFIYCHSVAFNELLKADQVEAYFYLLLLALVQAQTHLTYCEESEKKDFKVKLKKLFAPALFYGFPNQFLKNSKNEWKPSNYEQAILIFNQLVFS